MPLDTSVLFQPLRVRALTLPNRIVMAPMTRAFSPGGVPGADVVEYYRKRAEDGLGLILSEATGIERPAARNEEGAPNFHGDAALAGWSRVIAAVHESGGRMGPQLGHVGASPSATGNWRPDGPVESPSGLLARDKPRGQAMTEEDIADTISAFARGAAEARHLGFDMVEIHGAHGYLIDQFFWSATNTRTDRYGGATIKERARFAAEIVASVRAAVGPDMPVLLRVSQWKMQDFAARIAGSPDALVDWLGPLVDRGVDVIDCSQRRFWDPEFPAIDGPEGLSLAGWVKKLLGVPTIAVGSVGLARDTLSSFAGETSPPADLEKLVLRMERGEFDLIAVGRSVLGDPQWVRKVRDGRYAELGSFAPSALATLA